MADQMTGDRPSKRTKDRLARLVEQDIIECGKVARHLCQRSGSREVRVALIRNVSHKSYAFSVAASPEGSKENGGSREVNGEHFKCRSICHSSSAVYKLSLLC